MNGPYRKSGILGGAPSLASTELHRSTATIITPHDESSLSTSNFIVAYRQFP